MYIHSFLIKSSHSRFKQYYNRWANHEQSAKLALDLYVKTEKKMEEMQIASALTLIEVQFMKKAVDELDRCRMTLKWTYAMAYYLAKGNEKELFEDNQRCAFRATSDLYSDLLDSISGILKERLKNCPNYWNSLLKQKILHLCDKRLPTKP